MVVAVAVAVAVAGAVANPIHPQLIKFVLKYADFVPFKSNLVAPPCLTPARKAFKGGTIYSLEVGVNCRHKQAGHRPCGHGAQPDFGSAKGTFKIPY